jgi:hypothetical protein
MRVKLPLCLASQRARAASTLALRGEEVRARSVRAQHAAVALSTARPGLPRTARAGRLFAALGTAPRLAAPHLLVLLGRAGLARVRATGPLAVLARSRRRRRSARNARLQTHARGQSQPSPTFAVRCRKPPSQAFAAHRSPPAHAPLHPAARPARPPTHRPRRGLAHVHGLQQPAGGGAALGLARLGDELGVDAHLRAT